MPAIETASQKAARIRDEDRIRKRRERAARKEAGVPDPREIDRAIVDAIRDAPLPAAFGGSGVKTHPREVEVVALVRRAAHALQSRGYLPSASVPALVSRLSRETGKPH